MKRTSFLGIAVVALLAFSAVAMGAPTIGVDVPMDTLVVAHSMVGMGAIAGGNVSPVPEPAAPKLLASHQSIDHALNTIQSAYERLAAAADRLLNPAPQGVSDVGQKQAPVTLEGKLNASSAYAEDIASRLHALASRLEAAV